VTKLKPEDLSGIAERVKRTTLLREGEGRMRVMVHMGTCGIAAGARAIMKTLLDEIEANDVKDILVTATSCAGLCSREPMITIEVPDQPPVKYVDLTPDKVKEIFSKHIIGGELAAEYALAQGSERML
jgi:NADP-reducing hydrogenase subunit HndB